MNFVKHQNKRRGCEVYRCYTGFVLSGYHCRCGAQGNEIAMVKLGVAVIVLALAIVAVIKTEPVKEGNINNKTEIQEWHTR